MAHLGLREPVIDTFANILDPQHVEKWTPLQDGLTFMLNPQLAGTEELRYYEFRTLAHRNGLQEEEFVQALKHGQFPALSEEWLSWAHVPTRGERAQFTAFPLREELFFSRMCNLRAQAIAPSTVSRRLLGLGAKRFTGSHRQRWERVRQHVYSSTPFEALVFALRAAGENPDVNKSKMELFMQWHELDEKRLPAVAVMLDAWHHFPGYVASAQEAEAADIALANPKALQKLVQEHAVAAPGESQAGEAIRGAVSAPYLRNVLKFHGYADGGIEWSDLLSVATQLTHRPMAQEPRCSELDGSAESVHYIQEKITGKDFRSALFATGYDALALQNLGDAEVKLLLKRRIRDLFTSHDIGGQSTSAYVDGW